MGYVIYEGDRALLYNIAELGRPVKINDNITITFTGYRQYTGLQVAKDPGIPIVYSGSALVMLGLFLSFYIFPRRIWAKITPASGGCRVLLTGATSRFPARLAEEIRELEEELKEIGLDNGKGS